MNDHRITRRDLALAAMTAAAVPALAQNDSAYTGPLTGLDSKVDLKEFDAVNFTLQRYKDASLQLTYKPAGRKETLAWQKKWHAKLTELVGGFPTRTPLRPQTLEVRDFPGYRREKILFESRPGMPVLIYLLAPKSGKPPYPATICIPGHGRGVDDVVAIDDKGRDRTDKPPYERDFAVTMTEHGMAAVAIEPFGFGCRRGAEQQKKGLTVSSCQPTAGSAFLLGETMIGWRVYDIMRTIDWIETRPELNAKKIGVSGISGGGTCSMFSAALDPRISAAHVSCYLNTFRDSIMSISHCMDNYVPGILNWGEQYDVASLIAPRPFYAESGENDHIFPVAAARESFGKAKRVWDALGAGDQCVHEVFPGVHEYWGKGGIPFLATKLGA